VIADFNQTSGAVLRRYFDAASRLRYQKSPSGQTFEETDYDLLSRPIQQVRWAGTPHSAAATVTTAWSYDLRGRLTMEDTGAGGKRWYSYFPTGEVSQVIQNATNTSADDNAVWTTYTIGPLGRLVEIDKHRNDIASNCSTRNEVVDTTTLQYDTPYAGQESDRYAPPNSGVLAGRLTAMMGSAATMAFGYDSFGRRVL